MSKRSLLISFFVLLSLYALGAAYRKKTKAYRTIVVTQPVSNASQFEQRSEQSTLTAPSDLASVTPYKASILAETQFYRLKAEYWKVPFLNDSGAGGPFEILGQNNFMFVSRCGWISIARFDGNTFQHVDGYEIPGRDRIFCPTKLPLNKTTDDGKSPMLSVAGIKGLLVDLPRKRAFLSYITQEKIDCMGMEISRFDVEMPGYRLTNPKVIFRPQPCLSAKVTIYTQGGGVFALDHTGKLYFSIGDLGNLDYPQDLKSDNGKLFYLDAAEKSITRIAIGVRNPQGITWSEQDQSLYFSDHGPKGGDEINAAKPGDNFGWPKGTYGIEYDHDTFKDYDRSIGAERHAFGKLPAFAFVPSIGVNNTLFYPTNKMFKDWGGELLVTGIRSHTLYRLRIEDARGIFLEPLIDTGERIRTLKIDANGEIFAKADPDLMMRIIRATPEDVATVAGPDVSRFHVNCGKCHQAENPNGPMFLPFEDLAKLKNFKSPKGRTALSLIKEKLMPPPGSGVEMSPAERAKMIRSLEAE